MAGFRAVRFPGLPPGPGLLFRSFDVRFVHGSYLRFVLCSVPLVFSSFQLIPVRFVFLFVSAHSLLVQFSLFGFRSVQFVFSSVSACFVFAFVCTSVFIYIFSRILYTIKGEFQMYFLPKNMSFLRIVQIIDIKSKKFDAFGHLFSHRPVIAEDGETAQNRR